MSTATTKTQTKPATEPKPPSALEAAQSALGNAKRAIGEAQQKLEAARAELASVDAERNQAVLAGDEARSTKLRARAAALRDTVQDLEETVRPALIERVREREAAVRAAALAELDRMLLAFDKAADAALEVVIIKGRPTTDELEAAVAAERQRYACAHDAYAVTGELRHQRPWNVVGRLGRELASRTPSLRFLGQPKPRVETPWVPLIALLKTEQPEDVALTALRASSRSDRTGTF